MTWGGRFQALLLRSNPSLAADFGGRSVGTLSPRWPRNSAATRSALLALLPWLVSCGSVGPYAPQAISQAAQTLRQPGLAHAQRLLIEADLLHRYPDVAMVYRLRAGQLATQALTTDHHHDAEALGLLNAAQAHLPAALIHAAEATKIYRYAGLTYELSAPEPNHTGTHALREFSKIEPAALVPQTLCKKRLVEPGLGTPLVAHWQPPTDQKLAKFVSHRGYLEPITSVATYAPAQHPGGPQRVTLSFLDPTAQRHVTLGQRTFPLAADFTAPVEAISRNVREVSLGLLGLFLPQSQDAEVNLLEPYDPHRIPVLFVHGLISHPRMWRDVYNELRADPDLRGKYQFWSYRYPSGWPVLYSALRLRQELASLDRILGHHPRLVLIGHSMGGLVSRLQAISPGREIWNANYGPAATARYTKLPADHLNKQMMLFQRNPDIARLIFICVPHRGSKIADLSIVNYLASLIRLPASIVASVADLPTTLAKGGLMNGVNRLSPSDPTAAALDRVRIPVPYHSIIGDRGRGDTPHSSDGAVEYWSSHLDGAASESIVPGPHSAYDHPQTIAELKRILLAHPAFP